MNRLGAGVFAVACLFAVPRTAFGGAVRPRTAETASLGGTVYSATDNRRIDHANVRLSAAHGNPLEEQFTSDSGKFIFPGLAPAIYQLSVSAAGFRDQELNVDITFGSNPAVAVYLQPATGDSGAPAPDAKISAHEMTIPQEVRDLAAAGKKKIWLSKNVEGGLADLRQALASAPGYYEVYYEMGLACLMMGKTGDAEQNFKKSLDASEGKFGAAEVGLGAALVNEGDVANGEKALRHGIVMSPDSWLGYYELGKIELAQHRLAEAEKSAEQARSLAPNFPSIYRLLANIHTQKKNYPALLRDIDAYLQLDPDSAAGARAKQLRDDIRQKMTAEVAIAPTDAAPH